MYELLVCPMSVRGLKKSVRRAKPRTNHSDRKIKDSTLFMFVFSAIYMWARERTIRIVNRNAVKSLTFPNRELGNVCVLKRRG